MTIEILLPAMSPTMTEGTVAKWIVKEGDTVSAGDILAEIETDKATMELETDEEGVMGRIFVADGSRRHRGRHRYWGDPGRRRGSRRA